MKLLLTSILLIPMFLLAQNNPKGLNVLERAPLFVAQDQYGKRISLKDQLLHGSVVIVFYRGQWCPYCNKQLSKLEDSLSLIKSKGATLLAITPEKPENINKTITKTKASYPILYDEGLKIMKSYDVAFGLDSNTIARYKKFGIDFESANGINGAKLPVPALYIINQKGVIIFRHFDPDYTKRVSVKEILSHL